MTRLGAILLGLALIGCGNEEQPASGKARRAEGGPSSASTPARDADKRLAAAVRAAFPAGTSIAAGTPDRIVFSDSELVEASFGPILVSHGHVPDAAHVQGGVIAIHYLTEQAGRFSVQKAFPNAIETGSSGDLAGWSVSRRLTTAPIVVAEGGGSWQGCSIMLTKLVQLASQGPKEVASIVTFYDDRGVSERPGQSLTGRFTDVVRDRGFTVRYSGTGSLSERYLWRGGNFEIETGKSRLPLC